MNLTIMPGQLGVRPPVTKPLPGFYQQVGEARFRQLVADHYDLIKDSDIAFLFPTENDNDFAAAKKHAADFMIQICGGPAYFNESRGAPQMVGRHAPFRITEASRRRWLEIYAMLLPALLDEGVTEENVQSFWDYLNVFSIWMVNTPSQ
jgi:hemoglobin